MWEMTTLDDKLDDLIGLRPTYMRPPNLATSERMLDVLKDYHVITTNLNTDDSGGNLDWSKSCFDDGLEEGGSLILAHDTKDIAIDLATYMLDMLKEKNITGTGTFYCCIFLIQNLHHTLGNRLLIYQQVLRLETAWAIQKKIGIGKPAMISGTRFFFRTRKTPMKSISRLVYKENKGVDESTMLAGILLHGVKR
jgi:hypothetical protein